MNYAEAVALALHQERTGEVAVTYSFIRCKSFGVFWLYSPEDGCVQLWLSHGRSGHVRNCDVRPSHLTPSGAATERPACAYR
jgi:hypothetical protein